MTPQERSDKLAKIYEVINFPYDDWDSVYSPVTIGDCLDWYEKEIVTEWCKYNFSCYFEKDILWKWKSKRLPIDEQSDECVTYIYSLIK